MEFKKKLSACLAAAMMLSSVPIGTGSALGIGVWADEGGEETPTQTYTVSFNSNGGSDVDSITGIESSSTITAHAVSTKQGYTLEGWYK